MTASRILFILVIVILVVAALMAVLLLAVSSVHGQPGSSPSTPPGRAATPVAAGTQAAGGTATADATAPAAALVPTDANDPAGQPAAERPLQVLDKPHFTIGYDPRLREPAWVSYALAGPIRNHGHEQRPDRFEPDAAVANAPRHEDYSRSGYDRGHMCPAYAQFSRFGPEAMKETFITTNICPQLHALNAGRWEDLEALIAGREAPEHHHGHHGDAGESAREEPESPALPEELEHLLASGGWAAEYGQVFVTDGPEAAADGAHLRAGEAVPASFFMILLRREKDGHYRSLAFEMPNQAVGAPLESFLVPITAIEQHTGLRFLGDLPGDQQEALKSEAAQRLW